MEMDPTWTVFQRITDMESFSKIVLPELYLRPNVHPDVVEHFRIIRKLIEHSYFEYKFCDIAATQSALTLEMALKLRYNEINNKEWNQTLQKLIIWFNARHYFEFNSEDYLDSIRDIRNRLAHPTEERFSGANAIHLIENIVDFINDVYEDPGLRKIRMDMAEQILNKLKPFNNRIKCNLDNRQYFAYSAWGAFINNKVSPHEIHFYFNPTFDIKKDSTVHSNWIIPPYIYFKAMKIEFLENAILLTDFNNSNLLISEILDAAELKDFENWNTAFEKLLYPNKGNIHIHEEVIDTFTAHQRKFHKIN